MTKARWISVVVSSLALWFSGCAADGAGDELGDVVARSEAIDKWYVGNDLRLDALATPIYNAFGPYVNPRGSGSASELCLDVVGASAEPGAELQSYPCHGGPNQQWVYDRVTGHLRDVNSGMCVDVKDATLMDGATIQMYPCHDGLNQYWTWMPNGSLRSANSGYCLDLIGGSTAPETRVQLWSCHANSNQVWARPSAKLRNLFTGRCVDVQTQDGKTLQQWDCHGEANQRWQQDAGIWLKTDLNGRCMMSRAENSGYGPARVDDGCPTLNSTFFFRPDGSIGNSNTVGASSYFTCLDVQGASFDNGAPLITATCSGSPFQAWVVDLD